MLTVDRDQFMRDGYFVMRDVIPMDELEQLRASCETLLEKQKAIWQSQCGAGDPPGGLWDTARQPRIVHVQNLIDAETANAVETWTSEATRGVAEQLLSQPVAGIHQMQVMCNPSFDYGPAEWHRDVDPVRCGPLGVLQASLLENGPDYVQWNIPLYDDKVFWIIPGSHGRLTTDEEKRQILENSRVPVSGGVPVDLKAGDLLVYTHYLLHWGSKYTNQVLRRTMHGGHTTYPMWDDLNFVGHLSPEASQLFASWAARVIQLKRATERCLRAVLDKDRPSYLAGLDLIHPGAGPAGQLQMTVYLCKLAMNMHVLKRSDFESLPVDARARAEHEHGITLNWGPSFAERFTKDEADGVWDGFAELERHLKSDDEGRFLAAYQADHRCPSTYYLDEMDEPFTILDFVATWDNGGS